jgi:hypothetical protein
MVVLVKYRYYQTMTLTEKARKHLVQIVETYSVNEAKERQDEQTALEGQKKLAAHGAEALRNTTSLATFTVLMAVCYSNISNSWVSYISYAIMFPVFLLITFRTCYHIFFNILATIDPKWIKPLASHPILGVFTFYGLQVVMVVWAMAFYIVFIDLGLKWASKFVDSIPIMATANHWTF